MSYQKLPQRRGRAAAEPCTMQTAHRRVKCGSSAATGVTDCIMSKSSTVSDLTVAVQSTDKERRPQQLNCGHFAVSAATASISVAAPA